MKTNKSGWLAALALLALLFVGLYILESLLPPSTMLFTILKKSVIFALIAVSMNLLNGFTGLFSLGQAGFMVIGAYTYAILTIPVKMRAMVYQYYDGGIVQFALPAIVGILAAGVMAGIFAYLVGLPVLRLKSDYLAIATLGFAEIIRAFIQYEGLGPLTNGSNLLRRFPSFSGIVYPFLAVTVCILVIVLLIHSTYGRALKAIRDDETAAEAMGINLYFHKQLSFITSSFFAGIAGALLAMYQGSIQAATFKSSMTYEVLLIVVIGGMGSVSGSILASFLFVASSEWWLRFLDNELFIGAFKVPLLRSGFRMVVFSVIIMVVVLFYRRGIMGNKEFSLKRLRGWRHPKERSNG
jgi:branched-chain amino acid transport system permease protein